MRRTLTFRFVCLLALAGCGAPEPAEQATEAVAPGAGRVLRVDPALDAIVPADYKIDKLRGGFVFTEGPVWVHKDGGYLLFSDIPANAIYKWAPDGQVSDFIKPVFEEEFEEGSSVGSNGLTLDSEGRLVLCEHGGRRVSRLDDDGKRTTLVDSYDGKKLNSPNDAAYKSDGWLYFTDPPYGFVGQDDDPAKELDFNGIYRLSPTARSSFSTKSKLAPMALRSHLTKRRSTSQTPTPTRRSGWPTTSTTTARSAKAAFSTTRRLKPLREAPTA